MANRHQPFSNKRWSDGQCRVFAAMHRDFCYSHLMGMRITQSVGVVGLCGLLLACGATQKKKELMQLYEIPAAGRTQPVDNDSYYSPPKGSACQTIADAPSCAGGG